MSSNIKKDMKEVIAEYIIIIETQNQKLPFYEDHDNMDYNDKIKMICSQKLYYEQTDNFDDILELIGNSENFSAVMILDLICKV